MRWSILELLTAALRIRPRRTTNAGLVLRHGLFSTPPATTARLGARCIVLAILLYVTADLAGCDAEKRDLGAAIPSSPPTGPKDSRAKLYETNLYLQGEGGRMFQWFGCDQCHGLAAPGYLNLADTKWRYGGATTDIYASIAGRPGLHSYQGKISSEQTWQLAGYLHTLNKTKPNMRQRQANAQKGEPSGGTWSGALR
jgi:cytochrome c oxidase cbb3-type subunit 3